MKKETKIKTFLPCFKGFYGSIFEEEEFEGESEHFNLPQNFDFTEYVDWQKRYLELSKQFCNIVERELSDFVQNIAFESLYSPKEYNFTNDSINCEIVPKIDAIKKYIYENKDKFCEYLEERFKSRSGFISFYGYSFEVWKEYTNDFTNYEEKGIYLGTVLDFIGQSEGIDDMKLYYGLQDFHISNFYKESFYELAEVKETLR